MRQTGVTVARLEQEVPDDVEGTTFDVVAAGLGEPGLLLARYHEASHRVSTAATDSALRELDRLHHALDAANAWEMQTSVDTVLSHLGLDADAPFAAASGGRKRQTLLARALVRQPDVLLLDEPTNHLDVDGDRVDGELSHRSRHDAAVRHARSRVPAPRWRRASSSSIAAGSSIGAPTTTPISSARQRALAAEAQGVGGVRQEAREGRGVDSHRHPGAAHAQRRARARRSRRCASSEAPGASAPAR